MGKRVNLEELAQDDFYEPATTTPETPASNTVPLVPTNTIALNPLNKRPPGADEDLEEMAETIRERGVIQPLVACSARVYIAEFPQQAEAIGDAEWVVLIGNRRLQAARLASLDPVPIVVNDEQATSMYEVMLIENGQRRALPPVLEAEAIAEALRKQSVSKRELARRIGKTHVYIAQRLALLNLVAELRAAFEQGELKIELAREFGELPQAEQRKIVADGKPYRRLLGGNGVTAQQAARRNIRVSTPATAAESLRKTFNADELTELVQLLSDQSSNKS